MASRLVPVLGVLLLGWDARLALFMITCEVIALSAVLAWLFNYPERSPARGILFVIVLAPAGFLMWQVLAMASPAMSVGALAGESLRAAWLAVLLIIWNAVISAKNGMERARRRGVDLGSNNRILIRWVLRVFASLAVFSWVFAGMRTIDAWSLAAILAVKTGIEVVAPWLERRFSPST